LRTRIKICGITRIEDARQAAVFGADAIGLVFYAASARAVSIENASRIAAAVPPFVACVGVFLDAEAAFIKSVLASVRIDMLQFHGEEPPELCESFGRPFIKAIAMGADANVAEYAARYAGAMGFLLDSHRPGEAGGLGKALDWARVPAQQVRPLILAGGLDVDNVARAVRATRPYGVDVSSGVESAKGIKDAGRMRAFIQEVKRVDCNQD
jgi:phosphoribosylanthranilate isomerase